ncbi:MAG: transposase [Bacteroidetes bacterium]|nr:transposase [Bacteroidota bacterium]
MYKTRKLTPNSYLEKFNRTFRSEILDFYVFNSLKEVGEITSDWKKEYNTECSYESLGNYTSAEYLMLNLPEVFTFVWN